MAQNAVPWDFFQKCCQVEKIGLKHEESMAGAFCIAAELGESVVGGSDWVTKANAALVWVYRHNLFMIMYKYFYIYYR